MNRQRFEILSPHREVAPNSDVSSDRRPWIAPDVVAELSSVDEANNQDPALSAILNDIR